MLFKSANRAEGLAIQAIGDEVLVYDQGRHTAFCLNRVATAIWNACDGRRDVSEIAKTAAHAIGLPVSSEAALLAISDFERDGLMASSLPDGDPPVCLPAGRPFLTRRDAIARMTTGAAVLLPAVAMLSTPTPAEAYSTCKVGVVGTCILPLAARGRRPPSSDD